MAKFLSKENNSNYLIYSYKHEKLREVTFFDRLFKDKELLNAQKLKARDHVTTMLSSHINTLLTKTAPNSAVMDWGDEISSNDRKLISASISKKILSPVKNVSAENISSSKAEQIISDTSNKKIRNNAGSTMSSLNRVKENILSILEEEKQNDSVKDYADKDELCTGQKTIAAADIFYERYQNAIQKMIDSLKS